MELVKIYIDGSVKENPGPAGIGVVCKSSDNRVIFKISKFIGTATNNQAEYIALIESLKAALKNNIKKVVVYSDSELIVNQMNDRYKIKNQGLYKYFKTAKELLKEFEYIAIERIARKYNKESDILALNAIIMEDGGNSGARAYEFS